MNDDEETRIRTHGLSVQAIKAYASDCTVNQTGNLIFCCHQMQTHKNGQGFSDECNLLRFSLKRSPGRLAAVLQVTHKEKRPHCNI
jgi:hypothetical protein